MPREPDRRQFHRIQLGIRELRRQWWVHFVLLKNIENQSQKKKTRSIVKSVLPELWALTCCSIRTEFQTEPPRPSSWWIALASRKK
jgi:peptidyl-tRNA hydrolase